MSNLGDAMTPAPSPTDYPTGDRLDEIAEILAAGLTRLGQRKSTPLTDDCGESRLDFLASQRGHAVANDPGGCDR